MLVEGLREYAFSNSRSLECQAISLRGDKMGLLTVLNSLGKPGGGFIPAPSQELQPDVPVENILAMYEAAIEYGRY